MQIVDPASVGMSSHRLVRISDMIQECVDRGEIAGASVLVMRHGQVAYFDCHGWSQLDSDRPMTEDAIVRIYSMSKPITAVAALTLFEQGLFRLSDPISAYIPSFSESSVFSSIGDCGVETVPAVEPITIKQLFMHTSGIIYPGAEDEVGRLWAQAVQGQSDGQGRPTLDTMAFIDLIAELPLAFQPGTQWRYGASIDVLGALIQVLSGKTFGAYLKEAIFDPLGMEDTAFWVPEDKLGRLTALYSNREEGLLHLDDAPPDSRWASPPSFENGGAGLLSTIGDYGRFAQMLANGGELDGVRILGRKTVELMAMDHLSPELRPALASMGRKGYGHGLGVAVFTDPTEADVLSGIGQFGWGGAASTRVHIDPAEGLVGLLMPQLRDSRNLRFRDQFLTLMYAALT